MEAFVDREFHELAAIQPTRRVRDFFGRMIAISLALHLIATVILLSPQRGSVNAPAVSYLNLQEIKFEEQTAPILPPVLQKVEQPRQKSEETPPPPQPVAMPESDRLQSDVRQSLANAATNPAALQERSFGLGLTNGYFSSIAEGESLRGDIREYYFTMLRHINEKWWLVSKEQQGNLGRLRMNVVIARDGTILQKVIVRSSGNPAFDKVMLNTLDAASPLPPLPPSYDGNFFSAPLKFVGPLNLFSS